LNRHSREGGNPFLNAAPSFQGQEMDSRLRGNDEKMIVLSSSSHENRHAELVSASIAPAGKAVREEEQTLKPLPAQGRASSG
jgi:hypothetical protein